MAKTSAAACVCGSTDDLPRHGGRSVLGGFRRAPESASTLPETRHKLIPALSRRPHGRFSAGGLGNKARHIAQFSVHPGCSAYREKRNRKGQMGAKGANGKQIPTNHDSWRAKTEQDRSRDGTTERSERLDLPKPVVFWFQRRAEQVRPGQGRSD